MTVAEQPAKSTIAKGSSVREDTLDKAIKEKVFELPFLINRNDCLTR